MSTRSQIVIKESNTYEDKDGKEKTYTDAQWFYRHSDGYPSGNMPQLYTFMKWLNEGRIRNNVEHSAGWLILIGAEEYGYTYVYETGKDVKTKPKKSVTEPDKSDAMSGWKCGSYEICTCRKKHSDVEWLYTIDIKENTIEIEKVYAKKKKTFTFDQLKQYENDWEALEKLFNGVSESD